MVNQGGFRPKFNFYALYSPWLTLFTESKVDDLASSVTAVF